MDRINYEIVKIHFKETLTYKDGQYQLSWPWKDVMPALPLKRAISIPKLQE